LGCVVPELAIGGAIILMPDDKRLTVAVFGDGVPQVVADGLAQKRRRAGTVGIRQRDRRCCVHSRPSGGSTGDGFLLFKEAMSASDGKGWLAGGSGHHLVNVRNRSWLTCAVGPEEIRAPGSWTGTRSGQTWSGTRGQQQGPQHQGRMGWCGPSRSEPWLASS